MCFINLSVLRKNAWRIPEEYKEYLMVTKWINNKTHYLKIGTATYETAKYLNSLLAPIGKSECSVLNTETFVKHIKGQRIPDGHQMISFDVKSLFTNVPLNETINIILRKVYNENKIVTNIPRSILKELLVLWTKYVHFKFNDEIYDQSDGVAKGLPLESLFANIFMISLEENILPNLESHLWNWRRYIDIFAYVLSEKIDLIIHELNSYHLNIKFTYELELDNKLAFLDVCVTRINKSKIETSVYRRATNTNIYINWHSHAPLKWKTGTLRNLIKRTKLLIFNTPLRNEIAYIRKVFTENNDYPYKAVNHIIDQELLQPLEVETVETKNHNTEQKIQLLVPYSGKQGHQLLLKMKKQIKRNLPDDIKIMISYKVQICPLNFL